MKLNKIEKKYVYSSLMALVLILYAIFYFKVYTSYQQQKEELLAKLYTYNKIICKKELLDKKEKQVNQLVKKVQEVFILSPTEADASVRLQETISDLSEGIDLAIDRIEVPRIIKNKNGLNFISIRIFFSGSSKEVLKFLYKLESSKKPYFILDGINLRKAARRKGKERYFMVKGFVLIKAMLKLGAS